ncbi:MAG: tetratricopeptide repeat protein [Candidatus Sericytochromatia bacterium]
MNKALKVIFSILTSTLFLFQGKILAKDNSEIIFYDSSGNKISKEELKTATGKFNFEIYGMEGVSTLAKSLHNEARQYGQNGNYKKSIELLLKAHSEAKNWPYPLYDLAYTYLLQDDFDNALKYYKLTDKLAPKGFYTSKTALFTLENEKRGIFKKGLYKTYLSLEWADNQSEKFKLTKYLTEKFPNFAPGWKEYANFFEGKERESIIEKSLKIEADNETKGVLLINKALILSNKGEIKKAKEILGKIIFDAKSTYGNIEIAKFALKSITEK